MNRYRTTAYLLLLITTIISAIAGVVVKFTLGGISPLLFLTYRFGIASILGAILIIFSRGKGLPKSKAVWCEFLIFCFLSSTVALSLLFFGLEKTTVLDMSIITAIYPLVTVLAGVIFLKEHVTKKEKIGMAIALLGTGIVLFEPILKLHDGKVAFSGNLLIFIYLFVIAATAVLTKRLLRLGVSPLAMANMIFIVGFITIFPVALSQNSLPNILAIIKKLPLPYHLGVIYMAFLSGSLAYEISARAQKSIEVGEAALFGYLTPVFTAPLAIIFLGEKLSFFFILGSIIVIIGVIIAELKGRLKFRG
jgi:drug/metabolite transporter (DMT)-like permease